LAGLQPILAKWRELRATHWQGALSTAPVPTFEKLATDLPGSKAAAFLTAPRALGANVAATIQYSGPFSLSRTWRGPVAHRPCAVSEATFPFSAKNTSMEDQEILEEEARRAERKRA